MTTHIARNPLQQLVSDRAAARQSGQWFTRAAAVLPDAVDHDARTIDAVIATESPAVFFDRATGRVMREVLVADGADLFPWVPLLRAHETYSLESNLGSVLNSRLSGGQVIASLQFADVADVEPIWRRVAAGHLRAVSVGGRRISWQDIEPRQASTIVGRRWVAGQIPLRVTTRWVQRETSVVIFGADANAATRN